MLPRVLLVQIASFLSTEKRVISTCISLNRGLRDITNNAGFWQFLAYTIWARAALNAEMPVHWPKLSARALYEVLEVYTPLEGFHSLLSAFPWGLLCILRFQHGAFVGEVLRFGGGVETRVPIFRITFEKGADGMVQEHVAVEQHEDAVTISCRLPDTLDPVLPVFARFFGEGQRGLLAPFFAQGQRGILLEAKLAGVLDGALLDVFHPVPRNMQDGLLGLTKTMLPALLRTSGKACFGLVRGPPETREHRTPLERQLPQGLYVGNYGHDEMYGQFSHEVLLLNHAHLDTTEGVDSLFRRDGELTRPRIPQPLVDAIEATAMEEGQCVSFLVAQKVTGDFHVCAGQRSFIAVCGPDALLAKLAEDKPAPTSAQERGGEEVAVQQAWRGWGTLSYPGFKRPSWAPGTG
jgi:hypothetical protein